MLTVSPGCCLQMMDIQCNLDTPETITAVKEGALALDLCHPHVIATYGYATRAKVQKSKVKSSC